MPATALTERVSDEQFSRYAKLIYDQTGIQISPKKKTLLTNRLCRRLRATDISCFDQYFELLKKLPANDPEWDAFLQEITTHETYLFRDPTQWEWFSETYLRDFQEAARSRKQKKSIRVWSAACSTGDEAYTIACSVADRFTDLSQWKVEIVGTDIGVGALEQAREASLDKRAMRLVSDSHRRKFFSCSGDEQWTPKPILTKWTSFRQHNLMEPLKTAPFDIIFLKNVLIYFDAESKKTVLKNIDSALRPGGMLVTGPAEGVTGLVDKYERLQPWLHRKP
ncbi:MAG: protein-glutamate O-methyltransferase CheR [Planctomycetes bacterium]|nr:protein-glutamate O-methyltransferase CheR [Planctomycetota bacterium]